MCGLITRCCVSHLSDPRRLGRGGATGTETGAGGGRPSDKRRRMRLRESSNTQLLSVYIVTFSYSWCRFYETRNWTTLKIGDRRRVNTCSQAAGSRRVAPSHSLFCAHAAEKWGWMELIQPDSFAGCDKGLSCGRSGALVEYGALDVGARLYAWTYRWIVAAIGALLRPRR